MFLILLSILSNTTVYADQLSIDEQTIKQEIAAFNEQAAHSSPINVQPITIKKRDWLRRQSATHVTAESCGNIDNRTPVLAHVRNQTSAGWCYAFTAADLLSHKLGVPISAVDIALFYQRTTSGLKSSKEDLHKKNPSADDFLNAGANVEDAIISVGIRGACPEAIIRSDDFYLPKSTNGHSPDPILDQLIPDVFMALDIINNNKKDEYFRCFETKRVADMFAGSPTWELPQIEQEFNKSEVLEWLDYDSCHDHRISLPQNMKVIREDTDDGVPGSAFLADINAQLEHNNIVSIGYSPNFLYSKEYVAERQQEARENGEKTWHDPNDSHASTIVARRFNTNTKQCEYLIRNSWGPSCKMYDTKKYQCTETPKNTTPSNGIYEDGNIWVNAKDLGKALQDIEYLE